MNLNIKISISCLIGFFLLTKVLAESSNISAPELQEKPIIQNDALPITEIKHIFWIKVKEQESNLNYALSQKEILSGAVNAAEPNLKIAGSLVLKSRLSIPKCFVKLPNNYLEATNELGQKIVINLQGKIGNKRLTTEFIKPDFDEYNEVPFLIEGFIQPESLRQELKPSKYHYKEDLKLIIEFQESN